MHHALNIIPNLTVGNKLLNTDVIQMITWSHFFDHVTYLLRALHYFWSGFQRLVHKCVTAESMRSIHVISQYFWEVHGKELIQQEVANLLGEVFIFWSGKIPQIRLNGAFSWKPAVWSCMGQGQPDSEGFSLNGKLLYLVLARDWLVVYPRRKCCLSRWGKYFLAVHDYFSLSNNSGKFGMFI